MYRVTEAVYRMEGDFWVQEEGIYCDPVIYSKKRDATEEAKNRRLEAYSRVQPDIQLWTAVSGDPSIELLNAWVTIFDLEGMSIEDIADYLAREPKMTNRKIKATLDLINPKWIQVEKVTVR